MRRRADRKRKPTEKSHTAIETHQLHRDLALVVVHRQHRIKRAAFGAKEDGIGREWPFDTDAVPLACLHRRRNHVDLLAAEIAAVAGVRIEPGNRDPRTREAGAAHAGIRQSQRAGDTLFRQPGRDLRERNVRGHPRIPQSVEDVELAGRAFQSDHFCRKGDLVVIGW